MKHDQQHLDQYELQQCLRKDLISEVWKAFDTQQRRYVTIALLHFTLPVNEALPNFLRETRPLIALHHPHLMPIFEIRVLSRTTSSLSSAYMVMDYIEGLSLTEYLQTLDPTRNMLSPIEIMQILAPIGEAIDYIHQQGIIHGLITPNAILLPKSREAGSLLSEPKLVNLGMHNTYDPYQLSPTEVCYIAPEIIQGDMNNVRSDLYSLGIILYEMSTGTLPFYGTTTAEVISQQLNAMPPSPVLLNPSIGPGLTSVIMRALAKDPSSGRFPSAFAMIHALAKALQMPTSQVSSQIDSEKPPYDVSMNSPTMLSVLPYRADLPSRPHPADTQGLYVAQGVNIHKREGQQLDSYQLIRLLGTGSFGEVYLAQHVYRTSEAPVAIKVLSPLTQDDLQSFLGEARTLKHPNIVQVVDFSIDKRIPFIVMEYAPNGTLRQRHPKGTCVSLSAIVSYVKQIASALQYTHDRQFVHRNIKPENMLIGQQNQILLGGFGLMTVARSMQSQSVDQMAGTISYMAPEQIYNKPQPASDQYSLGVVVYEWLCGERPFQGTFTEIAIKQTTVLPPPLCEKIPTIAPDIEQIVMIALAKDPRQRFDSVLTFANALEQAYIHTLGHETLFLQSDQILPSQQLDQAIEQIAWTTCSLSAYPVPSVTESMEVLAVPPTAASTTEITAKPTLPWMSWRKIVLGLGLGAGFRRKARKRGLSLFAIARAELGEDDRASVGESYTIKAGMAQNRPAHFIGAPFTLSRQSRTDPIWFDLVLHTSDNIVADDTWHQRLHYDPRQTDPQLVSFPFHFIAPGRGILAINFYHEQRWLKTIRFEVETLERSVANVAITTG